MACFALLLSLVDIETVLDGALCLAIFLALRVSFLNVAFSICCFWIRLACIASVKEGFKIVLFARVSFYIKTFPTSHRGVFVRGNLLIFRIRDGAHFGANPFFLLGSRPRLGTPKRTGVTSLHSAASHRGFRRPAASFENSPKSPNIRGRGRRAASPGYHHPGSESELRKDRLRGPRGSACIVFWRMARAPACGEGLPRAGRTGEVTVTGLRGKACQSDMRSRVEHLRAQCRTGRAYCV